MLNIIVGQIDYKKSKDVNVMKVNLKGLYEYCKSQGYNYSEAQFRQDLEEIAVEELNDDNLCEVTGGAKMNKKFYAGICAALSLAGSANLSSVKGVNFTSNCSTLPSSPSAPIVYVVEKTPRKNSLKKILAVAAGGGISLLAIGTPVAIYAAKKLSSSDSKQHTNLENLSLNDIKPYATKIFENYCKKLDKFLTDSDIGGCAKSKSDKLNFIKQAAGGYNEVFLDPERQEMLMAFAHADSNWKNFICFADSITNGEPASLAKKLNSQINNCEVLRPIPNFEKTVGTFPKIKGEFVFPGEANLQERFDRAKNQLMKSGNKWSPDDVLSVMFDKKPGELPALADIIVYMPDALKDINPWDSLVKIVNTASSNS